MQTNKPVNELIEAIRRWREDNGYSFRAVSEKCGVNLATVYRIFDPHLSHSKVGSGIKRICEIAKISLIRGATSTELPVVLSDALLTVWDGTEDHARRLAVAISAIGNLDRGQLSSARGKQ